MENLPLNKEVPRKMFSLPYLTLGCLALILSYALFDRSVPVKFNKSIAINSPTPGEDLVISYDLERLKECHTKVEKVVIDGAKNRFVIPSQSYQIIGLVGPDSYSVHTPIDPKATPGQATLRVVGIWVCNYVHIIWPITKITDIPFEITNPSR